MPSWMIRAAPGPALPWALQVLTGMMQALRQKETGGIHKDPARSH